ncbi:helicase C-terminal domain-containing protein [Staphylococcus caprae]|uniref:3'-5' exonuclease DinG n=1 Tax=Staphylococcus caprae TaxID=29380 RepID=A0ABN5W3M3_9STAP|nr:helicase C-terminal domain-containing protein [Staphylococcus caprae]EES40103.1 putative DnaQ family exonuclease/DinG family helicase [Staphylococcus caprae M23864:W1]MBN6825613.1 DEAD/DEAH box helicase family protein [Staphylococcus caprae]MBX5316139.1 DEAD/DEAH box helicase family protein [Staphylococcus caprae]MBX5323080.1 DEAD/DEAH box helicase family protein [Staphylococcus caprae]MCI2953864.1 DEAD/DEAH box helicase family protein [Staphylococcus caprae]
MGIATYAVVDLETTGNQLDYDEIIQIGITFVRNQQIIDTYHSMIRTDLEIPPFIQALTSIEEEMLAQAPYFNEVAEDIYNQIKDCIFVAHNISFDLNFIKNAFDNCNIQFRPKKVMDTLELFKIAFPTDKSYQLSELAQSHNIPLTNAHRADEDATTTAKLMIKAFEKFENLPLDTQKQLYYLSKDLKYDLYNILFEMVRNNQSKPLDEKFGQFEQIIYRKQVDLKGPVTRFDGSLKTLYTKAIKALGMTYRPQQLYLSEIILDQLMHSDKAMIEAPLGSGKSLAYLLAALMYNIETGRHVMISTNTKLLQSQLLEKDIPALNDALNFKINASLIKSKNDYISLGLISQILKDETSNYEVSILKMQLLIWITETATGDIQELNLKGGQKMYFDQKIETYVPVRHDIHYYNFIKRNAQNIQIGITNHAHLIHSDAENSIYQLFDDCIIDEAHRLPDYALNQVTNELNYSDIKYQLGLIGKNENEKLLKAVDKLEQQRILEKLDIAPIDVFGLKTNITEIHDLNEQLFNTIYEIIQSSEVYDDDVHKYHYVYQFETDNILKDLHAIIDKLNKTLEIFNGISHKTIKSIRKQLLYLNDRFKQIEQSLKDNHTSYISIKNLSQKSTIRLLVKDYEVKDILTKQVLDKFNSLTFISGTLTFNHSFDAFKNWFNDHTEFNTYEVSTSMTAAKNTNVFIPTDVASYNYKNIEDYVASIVDYLVEYVSITNSKCLVLFTSYKMMHMVQDMLNELPPFEDYVVLTQQQNQNYKIVQQFNNFDKAILLGTSTFFEGFDFQANGIKCVMIAKLPFMNKHNTKYWLMDTEFTSTFKEYVLPDAVTRFRQGLGRLIRHEDDKGLIVSFDDRLVNSNFKNFFAQTLENYRQKKGNIKQFNKLVGQIQKSMKKKK